MRSRRSPLVAVDVNGADDPRAAAEGAASSGVDVLIFGPAASLSGIENVVDAPVSIAKAADPARAARSTPEASIVQAARAVAEGRADALVAGGSTGTALAAGLFNVKRAKGIHRPALALPLPIPGAPVTLLDVGANEVCRPEHLVQFAYMGAALAQTVLGVERPRVGLLSNGTEETKGREEVVQAHERLREMEDFVGNVEGFALTEGVADVIVTDGFTGNVVLKVAEAVSKTMIGAIRDAAMSSPRAKAGGMLLRPSLRGLRHELSPEANGGAYLLGLRKLGVVPHGSFGPEGWAEAVRRAARGVEEDVVGRTYGALEQAGALRRVPASDGATQLVTPMTREEVFGLISNHLADELDVDPARIDESTRFKEDLDADSLDLYTLVQELEDSYGVRMSDDEAAQILTVGAAVDFVLAQTAGRA